MNQTDINFIQAAAFGSLHLVKYLHQNGADINTRDKNGWTALMKAAIRGNLDIVKYLHQNGADINIRDKNGWSALMRAAISGNLDVVKYLESIQNKETSNANT